MHIGIDTNRIEEQISILQTELQILDRQHTLWQAMQSQLRQDPNVQLIIQKQLKITEQYINTVRQRKNILEKTCQLTDEVIHSANSSLEEMIVVLNKTMDSLMLW